MNFSWNARAANFAWTLGIAAAVCLVWESSVRLLHVRAIIFPGVEAVVGDLWKSPALFEHHAAFTMASSLVGFAVAFTLGVALAIGIVTSRILDRILFALPALVHSIPKVAMAPLFVIWLCTDRMPKVAIAVLSAILVIVVDLVAGMRLVDPYMLCLARAHWPVSTTVT